MHLAVILKANLLKEDIGNGWLKSGQNPIDLVPQIKNLSIKTGYFKEMLVVRSWDTRICGQVNGEEHTPREFHKRFVEQNIENKITTEVINISILTQEDRTNVELIKKIMSEQKTTLLSLKNQESKNLK